MNDENFLHIIRATNDILGTQEVGILGSQAILGHFSDKDLPLEAVQSVEADIFSFDIDIDDPLLSTADLLLGQDSDFHRLHGCYIEVVHPSVAIFPRGWQTRLKNVASTSHTGEITYGLCPSVEDLCISKLLAHREKDLWFVNSLIQDGKVDTFNLQLGLKVVDFHRTYSGQDVADKIKRSQSWLRSINA